MLAFMRVQPPVIRIAIVRRACGFREIVSAVAGSAIDGDARTLRSKRNEFDRDDVGEAEYRRALYVDGAPVLKLGNHRIAAVSTIISFQYSRNWSQGISNIGLGMSAAAQ